MAVDVHMAFKFSVNCAELLPVGLMLCIAALCWKQLLEGVAPWKVHRGRQGLVKICITTVQMPRTKYVSLRRLQACIKTLSDAQAQGVVPQTCPKCQFCKKVAEARGSIHGDASKL